MNIRQAIDQLDGPTRDSMCSALVNGDVSTCSVADTDKFLAVIDYDRDTYNEIEHVNHWYLLEKK